MKLDSKEGNDEVDLRIMIYNYVRNDLTQMITDVIGYMRGISYGKGGLEIVGLEDAANSTALSLRGVMGNSNPTDSVPAVRFMAGKQNGSVTQNMGASETAFQFLSNNLTNYLTILGNGYVGIATTTPAYLLDVYLIDPFNFLKHLEFNRVIQSNLMDAVF